jgi:small-conductance mechanosensitive channel
MNASPKQNSSLAVVSLVSGLLGWSILPLLGSIVAIITGHMARAEIRRNPDTLEGDGLAIAGLVLGWLSIALGILAIIAIFLFFGGIVALLAALGIAGHFH